MLFSNILVPVDGSKHSTHAFKTALSIAKKYDSKVTVVMCLEGAKTGYWFYISGPKNPYIQAQKKEAYEYILQLEKMARRFDVEINSEVMEAKVIVKKLVSLAKSHKIDLIVMGSHGRSGFDKFLLGSVANGVAQKVNCPVLIVK